MVDIDDAVERVRNGYFVFIDEPSTVEFYLGGDCDVFSVGERFQSFEYAFPFPKGSPYISLIDTQIVKYREAGYLDKVWNEWATHEVCSSKVGDKMTMDLEMLAGMFAILLIGVTIATALIVFELIYACILDTHRYTELSFSQALKRRLLFRKTSLRITAEEDNLKKVQA